jgi:hypothetical protein
MKEPTLHSHSFTAYAVLAAMAGGLTILTWCATSTGRSNDTFSGPTAPVPSTYFGMHVHHPEANWPNVGFGSIRLWDTMTKWSDIEKQEGQWDFQRLDLLVQTAEAHHEHILLTLGQTPAWLSSKPTRPPFAAGDKRNEKGREAWEQYVRTVVRRYRGRIEAYEVWNEPNLDQFYTGDIPTLVELTQIASRAVHGEDPQALVVSSSFTERSGLAWLTDFLHAGGATTVDVIGYHFYVFPSPPEQQIELTNRIHGILTNNSSRPLPLWDTEVGWSTKNFGATSDASAYVMRTFILQWLLGVERVYWYAWDNDNWVTLRMTTPGTPRTATDAARAMATVERWMTGNRIDHCSTSTTNLWTCQLVSDKNKVSWLIWSSTGPQQLRANAKAIGKVHRLERWNGSAEPIDGKSILADSIPVLVQ